jgi:hypothetical protein
LRRSYGFRTFRILELALYYSLGRLPAPDLLTMNSSEMEKQVSVQRAIKRIFGPTLSRKIVLFELTIMGKGWLP